MVAVRATLTASLGTVALVAFVVLATEAGPRMDNVCRSVDARGNVRYGDCPPATTYTPPQPVPPPLIEAPPRRNPSRPSRRLRSTSRPGGPWRRSGRPPAQRRVRRIR